MVRPSIKALTLGAVFIAALVSLIADSSEAARWWQRRCRREVQNFGHDEDYTRELRVWCAHAMGTSPTNITHIIVDRSAPPTMAPGEQVRYPAIGSMYAKETLTAVQAHLKDLCGDTLWIIEKDVASSASCQFYIGHGPSGNSYALKCPVTSGTYFGKLEDINSPNDALHKLLPTLTGKCP